MSTTIKLPEQSDIVNTVLGTAGIGNVRVTKASAEQVLVAVSNDLTMSIVVSKDHGLVVGDLVTIAKEGDSYVATVTDHEPGVTDAPISKEPKKAAKKAPGCMKGVPYDLQ